MFREILKLLGRDNLQVQALEECYAMADLCVAMVPPAVESLRHRDDAEVGIDIYELDRKLNAFERDVRRKVMTHLALGNTGDLSSGLTLVSIVIDLERIGDYSKNIVDLAVSHPARLDAGELESLLQSIEEQALGNFRRAMAAFKGGKVEEARKLMRDYKEDISKHCRELEQALVTGRVKMASHSATALALYTRFLKRISAHSRNLVSSIVNPFDRIGYPE